LRVPKSAGAKRWNRKDIDWKERANGDAENRSKSEARTLSAVDGRCYETLNGTNTGAKGVR
jgi:hypothetical protein